MKRIVVMVICCISITVGFVLAEQDKFAMPMGKKGMYGEGMGRAGMKKGGFDMQNREMNIMPMLGVMTDEQKEEVKKIQSEYKKQSIALNAELEILKLEIDELMAGDNIDDKKINEKIDKINTVNGKTYKEKIGLFLKVKKMLTPEQIKKMKEARKNPYIDKFKEQGKENIKK